MAKEKAVYAPGELNRVRQNLGAMDENEAKRMAEVLGGEVGVEKAAPPPEPSSRGRAKPIRRVEMLADEEEPRRRSFKKKTKVKERGPEDDPGVPIAPGYWERLKIDRYAAQDPFEIKSVFQTTLSLFSFLKKDPDYVKSSFVTQKLADYYKKIELLVVSTRTMFPKNNLKNNEQLRKMSPFMFSILDTIRHWNIERISSDMTRLQSRPNRVRVSDLTEILRAVYKPLFIFEQLELEMHIKGAYKLLYKILYIDNPIEAKTKYQEQIRACLNAYESIAKEIHYLLYPLLLKLLSSQWLPYQQFFAERRNRIMAFLNVSEKDRLSPESMIQREEPAQTAESQEEAPPAEEEPEDPEAAARRITQETERKAVDRGLKALESLFPQAGWEKLDAYPDLYCYFAKVLDLKKGYELIAPTDPLLQLAVLMRIMEELIFGLRYVVFDVTAEGIDGHLEEIISGWRDYEVVFSQEYLARLVEYCQLLESSAESRNSNYAQRLYLELLWIKRLCFLPHYRFESVASPTIKKNAIPPLYPEIRKLRKYLTTVAAGIEQATKQGGGDKQPVCRGIQNPWAPYNFQVANPLSLRLNALLGPSKRNNASLIYFSLSVITVLDYFVNNDESWAYQDNSELLFRSIKGEGVIPQFGVDEKIDADALFKQVMKAKQKEKKEQK